jgi:hypothetical protein
MDRTINEVDDDGLTTPLIANLSLNSDADGGDGYASALARDVSLLAGLLALARNAKFWAAVFCMSVPSHVRAGSDARHSNE